MSNAGELQIPYFTGSGLACVRMMLASLGLGDHPEEQLTARSISVRSMRPISLAIGNRPEVHVRLLESYGLVARVCTDGRVNHLNDCIDEGHGVIAFLGAKAARTRHHPWGMLPFGVAKAGYHPVVVTGVTGRKVFFHDPDPAGRRESVDAAGAAYHMESPQHLCSRLGRVAGMAAGGGLLDAQDAWPQWCATIAAMDVCRDLASAVICHSRPPLAQTGPIAAADVSLENGEVSTGRRAQGYWVCLGYASTASTRKPMTISQRS